MKSPFNIQFMTFGVDKGMEDGVLKKEPRTVAVGVVFRYQDLEAEDAFLINALTNEYDAEPAWNKERQKYRCQKWNWNRFLHREVLALGMT